MVEIPRPLRAIAEELLYEGGLEVVRGYLLERLDGVTPEDLYGAINDDLDPWEVASEKDREMGSRWAKREEIRRYKDRLSPETVLVWMGEDLPALASLILNCKNGRKWLARRLEGVKERLWPSEVELEG